jgi:hypothetical protein
LAFGGVLEVFSVKQCADFPSKMVAFDQWRRSSGAA